MMVILSMLSAVCPGRQGLGRDREMSVMSSIQGRREPQRRLRTIARPLRDSRTGTRLWASALSKPATNRQSTPATRKEAPANACAALAKSHHSRVAVSALSFTAEKQPAYCAAQRPLNVGTRAYRSRGSSDLALRENPEFFARAAAYTALQHKRR